MENIRNFSIIAHVDHGKSTLSVRLLEATGTIDKRNMKAQLLDRLDIERERGITIKSVPVRMNYLAQDGREYPESHRHPGTRRLLLRGLAFARGLRGGGAIVDAAQGVEAQTVANGYLAADLDLELVPILNKIDLPRPTRNR
ncbi:MAG: GTP-binding protein [Cloacibacillus evryensis]